MDAGQRLGAYAIVSELGSGGMGKVYLGEAVEETAGLAAGTPVALKVVHPHLLETPGFLERFEREAELGRRVHHENVVRSFEAGADVLDGQPHHYLAMEYVRGKNLRELLEELGAVPETLLREVALQTAAGLGAIHAEGIVHRDIKPENILITDDHEVRIMDLGVAKLLDASIAITLDGQFAGSLLYAAPEQFRNQEVGPASDLYSLGVLLYELGTGRHPFRCDDAAAVIQGHLTEVAPRAHERRDTVSLFFAEVLATLLAKSPDERFASAQLVRSVFEQAEESAWWKEHAPALQSQATGVPRIRVNRDAKLHGRDPELQALREAWDLARQGHGNTVFLEGEPGIGKTRLVDEFVRSIGGADVHVLYGDYPPSGGLGGISDAILGKFGKAGLDDALAPYLTETPALVPAFAALVKRESPPAGVIALQGDAIDAVCVQLMRTLADEKPLVWIVENLDFASADSRASVLSLARASEGRNVLLIATARPGIPEDEQAHFSRLQNYRKVALSRLGARDVAQLLEDAFQSEALAESLGMRILRKSDGVPFFVFEMIRGLEEGQFLTRQPDGSFVQTQVIDEIEVPSAVKDLIEGRLRGLDLDQRRILDVGAVLGMAFDPGLVAVVLEEKKIRVLERLAEIERRFGLVRGEAGRTHFDQNQIQEVIYGNLTPDLRAEYHAMLAETYAERLAGDAVGEDAYFLASHHLRGSRAREGLPHLLPALDHLQKTNGNEAAIGLCRRALDAPGLLQGAARVEILLRMVNGLGALARRDEQRSAIDEAIRIADEVGDARWRAEARLARGALLWSISDNDAAHAAYEQSLELAREAGDRKAEAKSLVGVGVSLAEQGRPAEGREYYEQSLPLFNELGDPDGASRATNNLGNVAWHLGDLDGAQAYFERSIELCREAGNVSGEAIGEGNIGNILVDRGRHAEAQVRYERYRKLSRESGNRIGEVNATGNLGIVFGALGRLADALAYYEKYRRLSRDIENTVGEGVALVNLGPLRAQLGMPDAAQEALDEARTILHGLGARREESYALHSLGALSVQRGDREAARRWFDEALALRREISYPQGIAATLYQLGKLERTAGNVEQAATLLDESLSLARDLGMPALVVGVELERAQLPGGDSAAALAIHENYRADLTPDAERSFSLWQLSGDRAHLAEAKRLLDALVAEAPEECRGPMMELVPLHREIAEASAELGG